MESLETAFSVDISNVVFGRGVLREVGDHACSLGMRRVAVFTDRVLAGLEHVAVAVESLRLAGIEVEVYDEVRVEPTDQSFAAATTFAREGAFDGFVSVGGGSVIDTCKAANLYATHPTDLLAFVNAPVGRAETVPGPLKPHIACPTTSGTGSECTGFAIFDLLSMKAKTGVVSKYLRPDLALIDANTTRTLPSMVVAATGLDVLSHALESFTARRYTERQRPPRPSLRPMSQGANPWSDLGCQQALRVMGANIVGATRDAEDDEAREKMMFAATLAGIAFGNAGCHLPHGMSYAVSGLIRDYRPEGYAPEAGENEPMVPHGLSVIVSAPAVFRYMASACPQRHLQGAACLGADISGADESDAGDILTERIIEIMRATGMPNGLSDLGYGPDDIAALTEGAFPQQRLIQNGPKPMSAEELSKLFADALSYW